MSKLKRFIIVAILFVIALFILGNRSNVNATGTDVAIRIVKSNYDEINNILTLNVMTEPGIKQYALQLDYDPDVVEVSYVKQTTAELPFDVSESNGSITLVSGTKSDGSVTQASEVILKLNISFISTEHILEEDYLLNDVISVEDVEIIYEDDSSTDISQIAVGNNGSFRKTVASVNATNITFDKEKYITGDIINAVSGIVTINYANAANSTGATRIVNIQTLLDNNSYPIKASEFVKGGWTANGLNPYVNLSYQGVQSNNVLVNVQEKVTLIQIEDKIQKEYEYGAEDVNVNDSMVYIHLNSGRMVKVALSKLIEDGKATISGFDSLCAPKETVEEQLTITINLPEFEDYIATADLVVVTIMPEISNPVVINPTTTTQDEITENLDEISVTDILDYIEMVLRPKFEYVYGEALSLINGKIKATYNRDNTSNKEDMTEEVEMTNSTVRVTELDGTPFDSTIVGTRELLVTYKPANNNSEAKTTKYEVTIFDTVESIEIIDDTVKAYEYGDDLNIGNTKVRIKLASQATATEVNLQTLIDEGKAVINGFDSTAYPKQEKDEELTVTFNLPEYKYQGTKNLATVKVYDPVEKIELAPEPSKKVYEYEEDLDVSNGQIKITYKSQEENYVAIMPNMVTEIDDTQFDNTKIGTRDLKVTYRYTENGVSKSKSDTYEIRVKSNDYDISLNDYEIEIDQGHEITNDDLTNYKIIIDKGNDTDEEQLTQDYITEYDKNKIGDQTITITYEYDIEENHYLKTMPFYIKVRSILNRIRLTKDIIEIGINENLDTKITNEYKIIPIMTDGEEKEPVQLTRDMITGEYNVSQEGTYNLRVEYKGKYADFTLVVKDAILAVNFDEGTMKKKYKYGEELDLTGSKIIVSKYSNEYIIELNKDTISHFKLNQVGHLEYDMSYYEYIMEKAIKIDIEDYAVDILLTKPRKTTYIPTETELDLRGAKVQLIMASGALSAPVDVTMEMISEFDADALGVQKIKVTYEGFEKEFEIIKNVQTGIDGIYLPDILIPIIITIGLIELYIIKRKGGKNE